jgi:hypothetical protein
MADRYLLESGAPDGYQLEDGSGVLLLDNFSIVNNVGTSVTFLGGDLFAGTGSSHQQWRPNWLL